MDKLTPSLVVHSVMSDSLWPHGLQHARLLCPSLSLEFCSDSCPVCRWCRPTVSSSASPSPVAFYLSQHQGKWVDAWGLKSEVQARGLDTHWVLSEWTCPRIWTCQEKESWPRPKCFHRAVKSEIQGAFPWLFWLFKVKDVWFGMMCNCHLLTQINTGDLMLLLEKKICPSLWMLSATHYHSSIPYTPSVATPESYDVAETQEAWNHTLQTTWAVITHCCRDLQG